MELELDWQLLLLPPVKGRGVKKGLKKGNFSQLIF